MLTYSTRFLSYAFWVEGDPGTAVIQELVSVARTITLLIRAACGPLATGCPWPGGGRARRNDAGLLLGSPGGGLGAERPLVLKRKQIKAFRHPTPGL